MKQAMEFRVGSTFQKNGIPYIVLKADRYQSTSGKKAKAPEMKFKIKDLLSGKITEINIQANEVMENIILDRNSMQFLYDTDGEYYFMNQENFEQIALTKEDLNDAVNYLKEEMVIDVLFFESKPVGVELPTTVNLKVIYTEPGLKGDTIGKATKSATLETGYNVQVPLFIEIDEVLKIDTRTGKYIERAK